MPPVDVFLRLVDMNRFLFPVHVIPCERTHLTLACTREQRQIKHGLMLEVRRRVRQCVDHAQELHQVRFLPDRIVMILRLRTILARYIVAWILAENLPLHRLGKYVIQQLIVLVYHRIR